MQGKTAIVTGSTSGIGLAIATALAAAGAHVVLNGFGEADEIARLRRHLARDGRDAAYSPADMTRPAEIRQMVEDAAAEHGSVDILVNNAGIQHTAPIDQFPDEQWDRIIAINLSSAFHATKAALPVMRRAGWGRIINIASVHGQVASPFKAAYVAAKHGIIGLTKVTALETANDGITANTICPGWVRTALVERQIEARAAAGGVTVAEASDDLLREKQPMLKFTTPEQLGALALFLCSDAAASTTGANFSMDGGWTAQ